ncbi:MAG: cyclodeaminase/cyclohydrolase family protein, partial [Thermoplasmata archaeon]|nr:cyclodeaminase/cyclohydrolase family protein [Thermoplasmata archaeon]
AMVSNLSGGKDFLEIYPEICQIGETGEGLKAFLVNGVDADTNAFNGVIEANKIKASTPEEEKAKEAAILEAYKGAIDVPLSVASKCLEVLRLAKQLAPKGLAASASDVGVGALMANAGMHGAILNVRINLPSVTDEAYKADMVKRCGELVVEGDVLLKEVLAIVDSKL